MFRATQLRHPAGLASTSCGSFVPNDIALGGSAPGFILLTGPNMGGKSTLLRQVCLAAVLAQVRSLQQKSAAQGGSLANSPKSPTRLMVQVAAAAGS
jgi:dsDNA-specific endonuclease/ATPase MutS2